MKPTRQSPATFPITSAVTPTVGPGSFPIASNVDPGAVGAGKVWIDISGAPPFAQYVRAPDNKSWQGIGAAASTPDLTAVLISGNDAGGLPITDLDGPTDPGDAANKDYVDTAIAAIPAAVSPLVGATNNGTGGKVTFADAPGTGTGGVASIEGGLQGSGTNRQGRVSAGGSRSDGKNGGVLLEAGDHGIGIGVGWDGSEDLTLTGESGSSITLLQNGNILLHAGDGHIIVVEGREGFQLTSDQGSITLDSGGDMDISAGDVVGGTLSIGTGQGNLHGVQGQALGSDGLTHTQWQDLTTDNAGVPTTFVGPFVFDHTAVTGGLYAWIGGNSGAYVKVSVIP